MKLEYENITRTKLIESSQGLEGGKFHNLRKINAERHKKYEKFAQRILRKAQNKGRRDTARKNTHCNIKIIYYIPSAIFLCLDTVTYFRFFIGSG